MNPEIIDRVITILKVTGNAAGVKTELEGLRDAVSDQAAQAAEKYGETMALLDGLIDDLD